MKKNSTALALLFGFIVLAANTIDEVRDFWKVFQIYNEMNRQSEPFTYTTEDGKELKYARPEWCKTWVATVESNERLMNTNDFGQAVEEYAKRACEKQVGNTIRMIEDEWSGQRNK